MLLIGLELGLQRLAKGHGLCRDDVHQRATLRAGEYCGVELLGNGLVIGKQQAAARAPEGLVGRGGHHVGIGHGRRVQPRRHQPGNVGHVHPEISAHLIGDGTEAGEVDHAGIGGCAGHNHLRAALPGNAGYLIVVNAAGSFVHTIGDDMEVLTGVVHRAAVGQVAAVVQIHAQHGISRLAERHIDRVVGLRTRVRLDVGKPCSEELADPLDGQVLGNVHTLAAAVIPLAGVALGVLVGEHAACRSQYRIRHNVLRCNELDIVLLPLILLPDCRTDLRIEPGHIVHILQNHFDRRLSLIYFIIASFYFAYNRRFRKSLSHFARFYGIIDIEVVLNDKQFRCPLHGGCAESPVS